jgi:uncharacterized membrane protein YtjA (UPF0391 family)
MEAAPKWFRPVAIAALLWNLLGCLAWVADRMVTADDVAKMSAAQQAMYAARPAWAVAATAIAVWGGAAGSLGLILGKRWANPLLVLSLIGVILQDVGLFGMTNAASTAGTAAIVLTVLVVVICIALVLLGRKAQANGWLS